jgi:hypothetical protein
MTKFSRHLKSRNMHSTTTQGIGRLKFSNRKGSSKKESTWSDPDQRTQSAPQHKIWISDNYLSRLKVRDFINSCDVLLFFVLSSDSKI